jgi:alpha-N-arabinofuranosidase
MQRRNFLKSVAAGFSPLAFSQAPEAEITLAPGEPGPEISPHIYGQFIEHLGGVIYDGIWVGPGSKIPNVEGIRRQFIDDMKRIGAPNFRWPGGCFADAYHWRDGIGPRERRPRTYNFWQARMPQGVDHTETNHFGTHEFIRLCRLAGAEPYIAANVGSGTPAEFRDWVLYCNAPVGTVSQAKERAANGDAEPFRVRYWGVGNESWGCGGNMKPGEYATEYRKFATQYPLAYQEPFFIAVGPSGGRPDGHLEWTRGFFEGIAGHGGGIWPHGWGLHYYTRPRRSAKHDHRSPERWYDILEAGARTEQLIEDHWQIMGEFDRDHRTRFVIDEWGVWQPPGTGIGPLYLFSQEGNLRDALHAAITFDIFNRHAEKVAMAQIAQTINCIHSLFLASGGRFVRTPTYYVFEMYHPHMGGRSVPIDIRVAGLKIPVGDGHEPLFGLTGSASLKERRLAVTLVNPSLEADVVAVVRLKGVQAAEARAQVLTHGDPHAANTLDAGDTIKPAALDATVSGGQVRLRIPKHAVAAVEIRVA